MSWHGCPLNGQKLPCNPRLHLDKPLVMRRPVIHRRTITNDRARRICTQPLPPQSASQSGRGVQCCGGDPAGYPGTRLRIFGILPSKNTGLRVDPSRASGPFSRGADASRRLSQSLYAAMGRAYFRDSVLGAPCRRWTVSSVRYQLYSSRMPGTVVSGIEALHVPLPWRRFLRGWFTSFRPASARTFRVFIQGGEQSTPCKGRHLTNTRRAAQLKVLCCNRSIDGWTNGCF